MQGADGVAQIAVGAIVVGDVGVADGIQGNSIVRTCAAFAIHRLGDPGIL